MPKGGHLWRVELEVQIDGRVAHHLEVGVHLGKALAGAVPAGMLRIS